MWGHKKTAEIETTEIEECLYLEIRKYKLTQMTRVQNYNSLQLFLDLGKALNHWVIAEHAQKFSSPTKFQIKSQSISRLLRVHTTYCLLLTTGTYPLSIFTRFFFNFKLKKKLISKQMLYPLHGQNTKKPKTKTADFF